MLPAAYKMLPSLTEKGGDYGFYSHVLFHFLYLDPKEAEVKTTHTTFNVLSLIQISEFLLL